ncbi:hypothetical protein HY417_00310 [Candidatus Kaiserbacteria bacterium]|nr:hypothetical protein [Candidatus Kaiserbacteria bacterium]
MRFRMRALFYGVVIYAVSYLATSILLGFGVYDELIILGTIYVSFAVTSYFAGRSLGAKTLFDIIPYAASWTIIVMLFDALTIPGTTFFDILGILLDPQSLLAYLIVFISALLSIFPRPGGSVAPLPPARA